MKKTIALFLCVLLSVFFIACTDNSTPAESKQTTTSCEPISSDTLITSEEPPVSSEEPPVSSVEPPVSSEEPPVSSVEPPVSSEEPPVSSEEPPVSSEEPPVSSEEPPVSSEEPPVSSEEPPVSSEEPPIVVEPPEEFDFASADLSEYIILGQYEGLEVFVSGLVIIEDSEVERVIGEAIASLPEEAMIIDRPAAIGDRVNVDYSGSVDGAPIHGGTVNGDDVVLGNLDLYPGLEDQIAGMMPGTTATVNIVFPEDYYEDLANKEASFEVTLNFIYPALSDELAVKYFDSESADSYRLSVRNLLEEQAGAQNVQDKYIAAWTVLMSKMRIIEYPEALLDSEYNLAVDSYTELAKSYGITYEELFSNVYGMTVEDGEKMLMDGAKIAVAEKLTLYAVARDMGLDVTSYSGDELYDAVIERVVSTAVFATDLSN